MTVNPVPTKAYSLHTTGYAFDILRSLTSGAQKRDRVHLRIRRDAHRRRL